MRTTEIVAVTARFLSDAAARRARAPMRLLDADARGWPVGTRDGDTLVLDEYGELWWVRTTRAGDAFTVRRCWPEEAAGMSRDIRRALAPGEPAANEE